MQSEYSTFRNYTIRFASSVLLMVFFLLNQTCSAVSRYDRQPGVSSFSFEWERTDTICWPGYYCRVHRLNDNRLMAAYEKDASGFCRFSSDNGYTWTEELEVIPERLYQVNGNTVKGSVANTEFIQLSGNNTDHPGRIIYIAGVRPQGAASDKIPYSIIYSVSDDGGVTWSSPEEAYRSSIWPEPAFRGCWEPCAAQYKDGSVRIYFADETPYWSDSKPYQNISAVESVDGGDSFGEAFIAAYTEEKRDGMPVVMTYEGHDYVAIEHYAEDSEHFHPQIIRLPSCHGRCKVAAGGDSKLRFNPLLIPIDSRHHYSGAPYLIETEDYFVMSYQTSEGSDLADDSHSVMEVVACPKTEIRGGKFETMRNPSRPLLVDQKRGKARWNSLCDLGGNAVLAVSDIGGTIVLTRGRIIQKASPADGEVQDWILVVDNKSAGYKAPGKFVR